MKTMAKMFLMTAVCGLGLAARAEEYDPMPWAVDMYDDCLSPYTDRTKSANHWYPNTTAYLLDANVVSASTVQSQLGQGDKSVLTGAGYLAQTNGVSVWPIKSWTMPTGGNKISVTGGMFTQRSDLLIVYLTDASATSAMFAVAQATASISVIDPDPSAVFNQVSDPGVWTAFPKMYVAPVYVDGVAAKGIDHWVTNAVPSGYTVVESAAARVTWGESGATSWYVVDGNVQIDGGVQCKGNVHLVLCDGAALTVANVADSCAGIATDANGSFTIYETAPGDEVSSPRQIGILDVTGDGYAAGIGGDFEVDGLNITINGGIVTARSGAADEAGAGIGGGSYRDGSNITINGGTVTATSGDLGAGIGGGYNSDGSNITINGGTVKATGGVFAAGIGGGGEGGCGELITINGGTVKATGGEGAAGIGGGSQSDASDITIKGGVVTAIGGLTSPGIGGGGEGACENVRIANAVVFVGTMDAIIDDGEGPCRYSADLIGGGGFAGDPSSGIVIDVAAQVFFNLAGVWDYNNEVWIEEPAPMPETFEGFVIMTPETQTLDRVLVGGCGDLALPAFALTNAVTGATGEITVNGEKVKFAGKMLSLPHEDSKLTLTVSPIPMVAQIVTGTTTNKYETIAEAFAAAQYGDTIMMIDDVTLTNMASSAYVTVPNGMALTFDLNGRSIYFEHNKAEGSQVFMVNGELTVRDTSAGAAGSIVYKPLQPCMGCAYGNYLFEVGSAGRMFMESGTIENNGEGGICFAVQMAGGTELIVNGGNILSRASAVRAYSWSVNYPVTVTVNGGYIAGSCAIYYQGGGAANVTINGGDLVGTGYAVYLYGAKENITLNINGGTMRATSESSIAIASYLYQAASSTGEPVLINITGGDLFASWCFYSWEYTGNQQVYISGGKFSGWYTITARTSGNDTLVDITGGVYDYYWMPSKYLHEGYAVGANDDPETSEAYPYAVRPAVASITVGTNTSYYGYLEQAFYYVSTNQTIDVWTNNNESFSIDYDFSFSVNSHGHALTGTVTIPKDWKWIRNGDICTYVPRAYVAQIVTEGATNLYEEASAAVAAAKDGDVVEILQACAFAEPIAITNGAPEFALDLNHHAAVGKLELAANRTLAISNLWAGAFFDVTTEIKPTEDAPVIVTANEADPLFFQSSTNAYWATTNAAGQVVLATVSTNLVVKGKDAAGETNVVITISEEFKEKYQPTGEELMRPEQPMENGLPAWQNDVLGLNPTNVYSGIYADTPQNAETNTVRVEAKTLESMVIRDGYAVKYRLDTKLRDAEEYTKGTNQTVSSFDVPIDKEDPTGVYRVNVVIFKINKVDSVEIEQAAESVNIVGMVKQTQVVQNAIVSVPWGKLAPREDLEIAVSNVVKTATLDEGDELRVYRPGKKIYESWKLDADKQWQPGTAVYEGGVLVGESPTTATIPRGSGIWLCRKDPSKPYYLYGQFNDDETEVTVEKGSNLIGAMGTGDYDLNAHVKGAKDGDTIIVPGTNDVPRLFTYKGGEWGYLKPTKIKKGSREFIQNVWTTDESVAPAGTGFWLHNNSGNVEVR